MLLSKKNLLLIMAIAFSGSVSAIEVKPTKYTKNTDGYPQNIAHYKISQPYADLHITQYPFSIDNNRANSGFESEISPECESLLKVYKQQSTVYVVTSTCGSWFGLSSSERNYFIYEFNDVAKLVNTETIEFKETLDIQVSELKNGVKISSKPGVKTGKTYHYEYTNGSLSDYSSAMNRAAIQKDNERICRGFYDNVYTSYEYSYKPENSSLGLLLSRQEYSWIPKKVKSREELSDRLLSELKGQSLGQRKAKSFSAFSKIYCD